MTRVSAHPAGPPGQAGTAPLPVIPDQAGTAPLPAVPDVVIRNGPVEWVMSRVIRKLAWSRLSDPTVGNGWQEIGRAHV